ARLLQVLQFAFAVRDLEFRRALERGFHDCLVFLTLQRTRGIHEPPTNGKLGQRGFQYGHLTRLKIAQVFSFEPPLDLRIARQCAGARARNIGEDTVECAREWQMASVGSGYMYVG